MLAVRPTRALSLAVVGALAISGAVLGFAAPAMAVNDPAIPDITVHVEDETAAGVSGVTVDVIDPSTMTVVPGASGATDALGDLLIEDVVDPGYPYWVVARGTALTPVQYTDGTDEVEVNLGVWDTADLVIYSDNVTLQGTVRHGENSLPYPGVWVIADETGGDFYPAYVATNSLGAWSIVVPRGFFFTLSADTLNGEAYPQAWDHAPIDFLGLGGCGCSGDEIDIVDPAGPTPSGPYDFDLYSVDLNYALEVFAGDLGGPFGIPGIQMELFKQVGTGWTRVDQHTTNGDGLVDFFVRSPGDYRLYYSVLGVYYTADFSVSFTIGTPNYDPDQCYVALGTLTPASGGAGDLVIVGFDTGTTHPCSGPPAPSGGTTVVTVRRTSKGSSFGLASATPTPTPTPTSSPSPSSSPSDSPSPSASPTPDPVPTSDVGFPWWIILIIVLILGIIITVIVIIRRR